MTRLTTRLPRLFGLLALTLLPLPAQPAHADDADPVDPAVVEKAAVCAGCHGEAGIPVDKTIPVIWGQHEGYLYIELRDYKLGNRVNESMSAIAATLEKSDMQALAAYFAAKPWPDLQQKSAGQDVAGHAETIAGSAQCPQCHLGGYVGDSANPRLANQGADYLLKTMNAFRSDERKNNSWMSALLKTYTDDDIAALAQYLAGL